MYRVFEGWFCSGTIKAQFSHDCIFCILMKSGMVQR